MRRGGELMHIVTKRALVAAAALTAAGLYGALPFHASTQAQAAPHGYDGAAWVDTASPITMSNVLGDMGMGASDP